MRSIKRHIYLERRRLTLIGAMSFAAGATLYSHLGVGQTGLPIPLMAGLVYMVAVVVAATVTTLLLPGLKRVTDTVAVTRLGFALWVAATHSYELVSSPLISATIVVGSALLLLQIGTWLPTVVRKLSLPKGPSDFIQNAQVFLGWLDNAAGYHAVALTTLGAERRVHV